jgi:ABC-2 type transport system ATP-binding protein
MSTVLRVNNLCKQYPNFNLKNVSFGVEKGTIMGFIGRNGAGKTTTLKSLMNLVHPSSGDITFFDMPLYSNEKEIKQRIGYATGGINYYKRKKIKDIINITKEFYPNWDDNMCKHYLDIFSLNEEKKLIELSEGMKVKFNLTIALSHKAELLILDEPTSGLDPVSREELLEIFLGLAAKGVSILFSTHITSDLEKCADAITYIKNGEIIASDKAEQFIDKYRLVTIEGNNNTNNKSFLGVCKNKGGFTALINSENANKFNTEQVTIPDLEQIMVHLEKESI